MLVFFAHPAEVCMTYAEHWLFSMRMAQLFTTAALKSAVHAFVPSAFAKSSTDAVRCADALLAAAGCQKED